jgi:disulfide bond formation protein DsbB
MRSDRAPALLILVGSLALLGGAYGFQYIGGLTPCEMCWWQRWALMATAGLAALALLLPPLRLLALAGLLGNAGIALFHAGVEQKWWQGITRCTAPPVAGDAKAMLSDLLSQPLVRCDAIPWQMFGISMAGWNFITSLLLAGVATWLMLKPRA